MAQDPIRENALARREAALAEEKRWAAEAQQWTDFIAMYDQLALEKRGGAGAEHLRTRTPTVRVFTTDHGTAHMRPRGSAVGKRVLETEAIAKEILRAAGRPMITRDLLEAMRERGFIVPGQDPHATLLTRLNRAPSLENMKPYGWRIKAASEEIGSEAPLAKSEASESDPETHSSPVEPAAGGGI